MTAKTDTPLVRICEPSGSDIDTVVRRIGQKGEMTEGGWLHVQVTPAIEKAITLTMLMGAGPTQHAADDWRWHYNGCNGHQRGSCERASIDFCLTFGLKFLEDI